MNKDALLATLIGFGIGLLITGILLIGPNIVKLFPEIKLPSFSFSQSEKSKVTPTPLPKTIAFNIESPLPDAIENTEELLVSGTADSGAIVVIAGPVDESAVLVGKDSKFAGKVTLSEGKNDITVTSVTNGKTSAQSVTVYFTEEDF